MTELTIRDTAVEDIPQLVRLYDLARAARTARPTPRRRWRISGAASPGWWSGTAL